MPIEDIPARIFEALECLGRAAPGRTIESSSDCRTCHSEPLRATSGLAGRSVAKPKTRRWPDWPDFTVSYLIIPHLKDSLEVRNYEIGTGKSMIAY